MQVKSVSSVWLAVLASSVFILPSCCSISLGRLGPIRRRCRNVTGDVQSIGIVLSHEIRAELSNDNQSVNLFADVRWTVSNPEGIPLDGFTFHFFHSTQNRNASFRPLSTCHAGASHLWVNTKTKTACEEDSSTLPTCFNEAEDLGEFCLCPITNCSLLSYNCIGTADLLGDDGENQLSILPTTRNLTFSIEFHQDYTFYISPYYRHYSGFPFAEAKQVIEAVDDCHATLWNQFPSIPPEVVIGLCCKKGTRLIVAQNVTLGPSRPNFRTGTINITMTWLPPETAATFHFHILPYENPPLSEDPLITMYTKSPLPPSNDTGSAVNGTDEGNCSYSPKDIFTTELYNLLPNQKYQMQITSRFNDTELITWCGNSFRCSTMFVFDVEDVDACNETYEYCDDMAECTRVWNMDARVNATCLCKDGFEGDGIKNGGGCHDIDSCKSNNTGCVSEAKCIDVLAPNTGVNCSCPSGFDGDGLESGSGCRSRTIIALAVALPLAVILVIVIIGIIWAVKLRQKRKRDIQFNKYIVECNNGILTAYENHEENKEGPWEPTFGDAWEIDRSRIRVGEVVGRGNYGVVHIAWLSPESKEKRENSFAKNGEFRNGRFYDALSTSVEKNEKFYDDIDVSSNASAVKKLQESTRNHENLANFLAEIGFMLNIGRHENIVRVYGCCSTEEPVYLVTEYLQYGDLLHFLWETREPMKRMSEPVYKVSESSLCTMARDVAKGMEYLERIRIIHGDIAARNILVGTDGICKISDFGLANDVYRYGAIKGHKERLVPYKWISPERMMSGEVPITSKSDVWSFGNLMYEMFTLGCSPHPGIRANELLEKLRNGYRMERPRTCSTHVYNIMVKCWKWRSSSRPGFSQILKLIDNSILQCQHVMSDADLVTVADRLDKEQYAQEVNIEMQPKENGHTNGNIAFVEDECQSQSRAM